MGDGAPVVFVTQPPAALHCVVCSKVFEDPVISVQCGHTYCRACITQSLRNSEACPVLRCKKSVTEASFIPNIAVSEQISESLIYCKYGLLRVDAPGDRVEYVPNPSGCPLHISLHEREDHEAGCGYAPVPCPNAHECGVLLARDVAEHVKACPYTPCAHGCPEKGTPSRIEEHMLVCTMRPSAIPPTMADIRDAVTLVTVRLRDVEIQNAAILSNIMARLEACEAEQRRVLAELKSMSLLMLKGAAAREQEARVENGAAPRVQDLHDASREVQPTALAPSGLSGRNRRMSMSADPRLARAVSSGTSSLVDSGHTAPAMHQHLQVGTRRVSRSDLPMSLKRGTQASHHFYGVDPVSTTNLTSGLASTSLTVGAQRSAATVGGMGPELDDDLRMPFNFKCVGTFKGHSAAVWSLALDQFMLFSGGSDSTIKVWDLQGLGCIRSLSGHSGPVHALVAYDGTVYSGSGDGTVRSWDVASLSHIATGDSPGGHLVCSLACNGRRVFAGTYAAIAVFEAPGLALVMEIGALGHWVRALIVEGGRLYGGSHNAVFVWDDVDLQLLRTIPTTHGSTYSLVLTDRYMVCGTYNQNIWVYDRETDAPVAPLIGHVGVVHSLARSLNGWYVFSASSDGSVKVWGMDKLLCVQTLTRHNGAVHAVAYEHQALFSASEDESIKIFQAMEGPPV